MGFKEITSEFWNYSKEGDKIEGVLLGKEDEVGVNKSKAYAIETKDGKKLMVWGTTVLDNKMKYVEIGNKVRITYQGLVKNKKQQDMKTFKVEVDK